MSSLGFVFLSQQLVFNSVTNCLGPRKFLHSGKLYKAKSNKELYGFLFNDFLLLTQIKGTCLAPRVLLRWAVGILPHCWPRTASAQSAGNHLPSSSGEGLTWKESLALPGSWVSFQRSRRPIPRPVSTVAPLTPVIQTEHTRARMFRREHEHVREYEILRRCKEVNLQLLWDP